MYTHLPTLSYYHFRRAREAEGKLVSVTKESASRLARVKQLQDELSDANCVIDKYKEDQV